MSDTTITFDAVFRSWLVRRGEAPTLIIKTGFLKETHAPGGWTHNFHNFWVYSGDHILLGTLEPCRPIMAGDGKEMRVFLFHRHSRNDDIVMPGAYDSMEGVIADLLAMRDLLALP